MTGCDDFDAAGAYLEFLNGGATVTDWIEIKEQAESLFRVRKEAEDDDEQN